MAEQQKLDIETRLGPRSIDPDKVLYFPRGIAGFENLHEFTLLRINANASMLLLQSMEQATLGLLVTDPFSFLPEYPARLSDAEEKLLRLKDKADLLVLVTVSIPAGKPEDAKLNLSGPIMINSRAKIGLQVPQDIKGPTQVRLARQQEPPAEKD